MFFSDMELAIETLSGGKNVIIRDDRNIGSVMVRIPRFNLGGVISGAPDTPHPMFIVNGVVKDEIYIGKYLGVVKNGRGYSLPNKLPDVGMTYDQALKYCYDKGPGWHLTSNAEYAGLALWCKANGFYPRGNNKYGQSVEKPFERGRCASSTGNPTVSYTVGQKVTLTSTGAPQAFDPGNAKKIKLEAYGVGSAGMFGVYDYGDLDCPALVSLPIKAYANTTTGDADISIGGTAITNRILYADKGKIGGGIGGSKMTISAGVQHTVGLKADGTCVAVGLNTYGQCDVSTWKDIVSISAGNNHTVGLKADGTCVAVGRNNEGECTISTWTGIVAISAGGGHTVGLKAGGTCVVAGSNLDGQYSVSTWTDIVAISTISSHIVGLKADGTCVSTGKTNEYGQCNVSSWTGIVAISAGYYHTVGLKADGTCVAVGRNTEKQCDISKWTGIVAISAGYSHTVGLKADGTCVAVGYTDGRCNVSSWTGIVAIIVGQNNTVGLKADGTCVAVGTNDSGQCNVSTWTGIMKPGGNLNNKTTLSAGYYHTVGLKADGTCVAVGRNDSGQCNVSTWNEIISINAGWIHTVGLKAGGTCVAIGDNSKGQCNVSTWSGIVAISVGAFHTVGLKADGTCVAVGNNGNGQCNVTTWTGIVAISAGFEHTVGLKADGTCVAVGLNSATECNVTAWTGIVAISAGRYLSVGLKTNGTCVAVGSNINGQCNISSWTGIVAISAHDNTVGLKADGTCIDVGDNSQGQSNVSTWAGIVSISTCGVHTVGLKADGTCVAVGENTDGKCNVSTWANIMKPSAGISSKSNSFVIGNGLCILTHPNGLVLTNTGLQKGVNNLATSYCAITVLELYDNRTYGGTGPVSWAHDNTPDGIYDLNGNVFEYASGLRLNNGEINIIKDNDAAIQNMDHSPTSLLWKAILQDGSLVAPGTTLTLKYDGNNPNGNKTGKINTVISALTTDASNGGELFYSMSAASGITVPQILKSLALYPIDTTDTCGDWLSWYNHKEVFGARGGGYAGNNSTSGQFKLVQALTRSEMSNIIGFRVAYYKP